MAPWPVLVLGGSVVAAVVYVLATTRRRPSEAQRKKCIAGLYNLGNTCYANALIQGLSSVPAVVQWLKKLQCDSEETKFVAELQKLFLELEASQGETLSAHAVSDALIGHGWNIGYGVEHDLHELLNVFQSTWEEELALRRHRLLSCSLIQFPTISRQLPAGRDCVMEKCREEVRMDSQMRAPCTGITATQLKCVLAACGYRKVRQDSFSVISLAIPTKGAKMTVESLLRNYFRVEVIRGAECDLCVRNGKKGSGLIKKQGFCKLPHCLILRIERVGVLPSGTLFKLSEHVDFAETLDVRDFCFYRSKESDYASTSDGRLPEDTSRIVGGAAGNARRSAFSPLAGGSLLRGNAVIDGGSFVAESRESARYKYQLRAVSEHRGIAETGHFVTYRRGTGPMSHAWFLTNDSKVTRVSYQEVSAAQAYMLYYEKIRIL